MAKPAPASLQRHGINQVADNLPPGVEVARFERDFALIFREELAAKFLLGTSGSELARELESRAGPLPREGTGT